MKTQLLKVVNNKTKWPLGIFIAVWIIVLYMAPQKYQYVGALEVPLTIIDSWVPLSAPWIWVYISYYFYLAAAFLLAKDEQNSNQIFYSFFFSAIVSTVIFFLFPTTISRELYPITDTSTWSAWMLQSIRITDASLNCAPSMHCAMSAIAAGTFLRERTWYRWPAAAWSVLIFYSTMATKQHYWWDVVTGVLLGVLTWAFFIRADYVKAATLPAPDKQSA